MLPGDGAVLESALFGDRQAYAARVEPRLDDPALERREAFRIFPDEVADCLARMPTETPSRAVPEREG